MGIVDNQMDRILQVVRYRVRKGVQLLIAHLQLGDRLTQRCLGSPTCRDVADVALDYALLIDPIDIADKFDMPGSAITRFERQILVPDIAGALQLAECSPS